YNTNIKSTQHPTISQALHKHHKQSTTWRTHDPNHRLQASPLTKPQATTPKNTLSSKHYLPISTRDRMMMTSRTQNPSRHQATPRNHSHPNDNKRPPKEKRGGTRQRRAPLGFTTPGIQTRSLISRNDLSAQRSVAWARRALNAGLEDER
ncbi:hypothetical protein M430DRAFT_276710, partial [Amorphotheca resinae ATCC 22711]